MGPLGWQETVFIFVLALLIFGPKKLPELGKNLAKGLAEFRRASNELKSTFDREMKALERENESLSTSLKEVTNNFSLNEHQYDYSSYYDGSAPYGSVSHDSPALSPTTTSASAPLGAESTALAATAVPALGAAESVPPVTPATSVAPATPALPVNGEAAAEHPTLKT
jgi:TatA/E family protein of Tat protein translocase